MINLRSPTTAARCTRRPHAPHSERSPISRAVVLREAMYELSASEAQAFSWGLFFRPVVFLNFDDLGSL